MTTVTTRNMKPQRITGTVSAPSSGYPEAAPSAAIDEECELGEKHPHDVGNSSHVDSVPCIISEAARRRQTTVQGVATSNTTSVAYVGDKTPTTTCTQKSTMSVNPNIFSYPELVMMQRSQETPAKTKKDWIPAASNPDAMFGKTKSNGEDMMHDSSVVCLGKIWTEGLRSSKRHLEESSSSSSSAHKKTKITDQRCAQDDSDDTVDSSVVFLGQRWDNRRGASKRSRTETSSHASSSASKRTKTADDGRFAVAAPTNEQLTTLLPERECWQADLDAVQGQFRDRGQLGKGGFGFVSKAVETATGNMVVLKWQRSGAMTRKECRSLSTFAQHPNIVQTVGILQGTYGWFLVTEYDGGHDLKQEVQCNGLYSDAHVVHRDIKPHNIILTATNDHDEDAAIKLIDFGLSCTVPSGQKRRGGTVGTPHYMAPEVGSDNGYDAKADLYSVGCTGYYLLRGKHFDPTDWSGLKGSTVEFLRMLTNMDPSQRPSAEEALAHPWLAV